MNDRPRFLVVEDAPWNCESAKQTLEDLADLEILTSVDDAYERLVSWMNKDTGRLSFDRAFDGVLTDLFLPVKRYNFGTNMSYRAASLPVQIPGGLVVALAAVNVGIPAVIVTDTSHHDDWLVNMLDIIEYQQTYDGEERSTPTAMPVSVFEARTECLGLWVEELDRVVPRHETQTMLDAGLDRDKINGLPAVKNWAEACKRSLHWPEVFGSDAVEPAS